jgi:uncharacterized protein (TIGR03437 family)
MRINLSLFFVFCSILTAQGTSPVRTMPQRPVFFEQNRGQAPAPIRFLQRAERATLGFAQGKVQGLLQDGARIASYELTFPGARQGVAPVGEQRQPGLVNWMQGNRANRWISGISTYASVRYPQLYDGVDLLFHARAEQLEYDFELQPGANPEIIRLRWSGEGQLSLNDRGELRWQTAAGVAVQAAPVAYQTISGRRVPVEVRYELNDGVVRFQLGHYDRRLPLVIDPVLTYGSYLGGNRTDLTYTLAVDAAGSMYIAGSTQSPNFPLGTGAFQRELKGDYDCFVTKISAQGALVYSTIFGGTDQDTIESIAVDPQGSVYFAGWSTSADYPVVNPRQATNRGGAPEGTDAIFGRLNPAGSALLFSSYWGGNLDDEARAIALDANGNFYIAGFAISDNFPVGQGGFQTSNRGFINGFVTKFNRDSTVTSYSTYIGGRVGDYVNGITVDSTGAAYITGYSASSDFPTLSAFQSTNRGGTQLPIDAFVAKLNPAGTALVYSTFYGGAGDDFGRAITIDRDGNAYVVGYTGSTGLQMTNGAIQRDLSGPRDAFLIKVGPRGDALLYGSYFGGTRDDLAFATALGPDGSWYVTGRTTSTNLRVVDPLQAANGGADDVFLLRVNPAGDTILQSTYLGGSSIDAAFGIAVNNQGVVYLAGESASVNLPVSSNGFQRSNGGGNTDAFLAVIDSSPAAVPLTLSTSQLTFTGAPGASIPAQNFAIRVTSGTPTWTVETATATGGAWLNATPRSGTGAATIDVSVTPGALTTGSYSGTVTVTNTRLNTRSTVAVTLTLGPAGGTVPNNGVVSAASFTGGGVAPGQLVTIFGAGIGPAQLTGAQLTASGAVATTIAETRVLFGGIAAPLIYVSATQVSAIVPYGVTGTTTPMQVEFRGVRSNAVSLPLVATAPGLFTANSSGRGPGAFLNQDGSANNATNPARPGDIIVLFGTGEGAVDPPVADGTINATTFPRPREPITVRIGGKDAEVLYGGAAPGLVAGVFQVNVRIPADVEPGNAPVVVTIGRASSSPEVTVAVR